MASGDAQAIDSLVALRDCGVTLAIDDFGTGYSNMQYLTRLPAEVLKLDRSFVLPLGRDERQTRLARSILSLAHGLGYSVVAEGIETEEARELLAGWGCEEGQGYLFSRPLPPKAFADWLAAVTPAGKEVGGARMVAGRRGRTLPRDEGLPGTRDRRLREDQNR